MLYDCTPGASARIGLRYHMHPLAADPHVEMGKLPRRTGQDAGIAGRAETIQRLGCDLPDFSGGENVLGLPARQSGQHVGGVAVEVDV